MSSRAKGGSNLSFLPIGLYVSQTCQRLGSTLGRSCRHVGVKVVDVVGAAGVAGNVAQPGAKYMC